MPYVAAVVLALLCTLKLRRRPMLEQEMEPVDSAQAYRPSKLDLAA